ncbi:4'-phosphopantetheinyl transferase family protein [Blastococcus sp. SYSU DS0539]
MSSRVAVPVAAPPGPPDIAVRRVDLAAGPAELARGAATLTHDELARARRGTPAVHRRRVLLRAALRAALAHELGTAPHLVPLATTPAGRPYLDVVGTELDVSCSASGSLGLVAVARGCRVGVDVQEVAPWSPDVLEESWLHDSERRAIERLPATARAVAATRAWTQKEAVLKARGTGLREDPAGTVTTVGRLEGAVADWTVRDVPVPDGWVASLAVPHETEAAR